jgi:hypothetical protein
MASIAITLVAGLGDLSHEIKCAERAGVLQGLKNLPFRTECRGKEDCFGVPVFVEMAQTSLSRKF